VEQENSRGDRLGGEPEAPDALASVLAEALVGEPPGRDKALAAVLAARTVIVPDCARAESLHLPKRGLTMLLKIEPKL
jgi:hypothetical protein